MEHSLDIWQTEWTLVQFPYLKALVQKHDSFVEFLLLCNQRLLVPVLISFSYYIRDDA
jgi:hypothetical protein